MRPQLDGQSIERDDERSRLSQQKNHMASSLRTCAKKVVPTPIYRLLAILRRRRDLLACFRFLYDRRLQVPFRERLRIVRQLYTVSFNVPSPHTQEEILTCIRTILSVASEVKGVVVEAGCFKGSSTAKFSLAADIVGKKLIVFDSFQGLPETNERHFKRGDYCGALEEVKQNVQRFGKGACCTCIPGWFDDTMPGFAQSIAVIYLDVDLASSTRTCLRYLYPLLEPGGVLYSQDGHLSPVIDVFDDDEFWLKEIGCKKPEAEGLGTSKLIRVTKEA